MSSYFFSFINFLFLYFLFYSFCLFFTSFLFMLLFLFFFLFLLKDGYFVGIYSYLKLVMSIWGYVYYFCRGMFYLIMVLI